MRLHRRVSVCLVLLLAALSLPFVTQARGQKKGTVALDSFTYDKVLTNWLAGPDRLALVRIDKEYSYGDSEDAFKAFAKIVGDHGTSGPTANLLVVEIGVQEYGDKINQDLADRYRVTKEEYPKFLLFTSSTGLDNGIFFSDEIDKEGSSLLRFVQNEGDLDIGLPGTYKDFDGVATGFASADQEGMQLRMETMKQLLALTEAAPQPDADKVESGKVYLKLMERVLEQGPSFLEKEEERLQKLVTSKTSEEKKEAFKKRLNIIPSLQDGAKGKEEL